MSKPLRKDRPEWARKRIDDAYLTAERGEGWLALSRAWNVTQAAALQWCRDNVPREICAKIGENGMALCTRGRTRKYEFAKPRLVVFDPLAKRAPEQPASVEIEPTPYAEAVSKGAITQDEADFLVSERERIAAAEQAKFFAEGMMADADRHQSDQRSIVEKIGGVLGFKREKEEA